MKHSRKESGGRRALDMANTRAGKFLIQRQNLIYLILVGIGIQYLLRSALGSPSLVSEGAAFIMVGCVGLIMSLTTVDIGKSLKDATHEEGEKTRAYMGEAISALGEQLGSQIAALGEQLGSQIAALGEQMNERDRHMDERMAERDRRMDERMAERDRRMDERLGRMSASIEAMSADNRAFFKQMLEAQNRILEKAS